MKNAKMLFKVICKLIVVVLFVAALVRLVMM